MKTIVVANQKGGVGKTTLAVHLACRAHERGARVLMIDLDSQASLTRYFDGAGQGGDTAAAASLFNGSAYAPDTLTERLALLRADIRLTDADKADALAAGRHLRAALRAVGAGYDVCVIDTPPGGGSLLFGGLAGANAVVIPTSTGRMELDGAQAVSQTIDKVRQSANPQLQVLGIQPVKINSRSAVSLARLHALRVAHGAAVLPDVLMQRNAVQRAADAGRIVWLGTKGSSHLAAAREWQRACDSILDKAGVQQNG
ncbi:ParA-like (IncC) ATPase [Thiomonas arsenitoxydans]|uniref:ParA-like (IncC) ATPase n=1 Tax=Thiomonas arsenitoxydans (strain DSM 22701 / CIP 110005 / 3As) TaxID=426114 RepID=D6CVR0_THIA3|nr:ParA family protein [Thiomonas arsenitoxydans]CAZ90399.1 ParA-like (IncC) ATPase [Thiomonas arsenitoxydans]CQR32799.1 ParA-like (IncC) ATPase [Thiomonas arsenitoxydans]CQR45747.1 ParA-like (IncC) ATPase [Thiomonas sp. CB3]